MFTRPSLLLRIEDFTLLIAAVLFYRHLHHSWLLFALLFFVPDVFMLGYLINARIGAVCYNIAHTLAFPILLFGFTLLHPSPTLAAIALIWFAHIVFDRTAGYGLKYPTAFKDTHLQHIP